MVPEDTTPNDTTESAEELKRRTTGKHSALRMVEKESYDKEQRITKENREYNKEEKKTARIKTRKN